IAVVKRFRHATPPCPGSLFPFGLQFRSDSGRDPGRGPMSDRYHMPSNETLASPSYARRRASQGASPRAATASTLPPDVTTDPSGPGRVPAWKTGRPATASAPARPEIGAPGAGVLG